MISIIVPTFNRQDYIVETLKSLLEQTYTDWECIIVDDGSTDETLLKIKPYLEKDLRISFHKRPENMKKGANSCRNFGFTKAKGEYIKFLDSDDMLDSATFVKQLDILESNPSLKVCFSYGRYFNDTTKEIQELWSRNTDYADFLYGHIINQIRWQTADPLWRKSFFSELPFKEGLMNSQEWLMHGQSLLKLKKEEIYNLKETFTLIRRGNLRMSSDKSSLYYKNQKRARLFLINDCRRHKIIQPKYYFQLMKQVAVFFYWEMRNKSK